MSGLDGLTREELLALVLSLHERVQAQDGQIAELNAVVERQAERIAELEAEVLRLRGGGSSAPLSIKSSVPKRDKGPRKKRKQSFSRHTLRPTRVICHALESCPECGRRLSGGSVKWRHQVLEMPKAAVEVTDHLFLARYCGVCCRRYTPDPSVVLADRMSGFIGELFTFVADPRVPFENNAAERAVRPAVVARKISGGSRSARGSKTCSILRTLFETWTLQGRNTIDACREMITASAKARTAAAKL